MRVVTFPAYTTSHPNVSKDTRHWHGYRVWALYDEREEHYPRTEFILNALGLSQWRLAILLYHQPEKYDPCHPKLWMFRMKGMDHDLEMHPIADVRFPLVYYQNIGRRNRGMVNEAKRRLQLVEDGPQFAVLVSFAFPVYGDPGYDPPVNNPSAFQRVVYGGFVQRLLTDFADLCRRSRDPDMLNAAALAEMAV